MDLTTEQIISGYEPYNQIIATCLYALDNITIEEFNQLNDNSKNNLFRMYTLLNSFGYIIN